MYETIDKVFEEIYNDKKYVKGNKKTISFDMFKKYLLENITSAIVVGNAASHNYPMNIEFENSEINADMNPSSSSVINLTKPEAYKKMYISRFFKPKPGSSSYNSIYLEDINFNLKLKEQTRKSISDTIVELKEKIEDCESLLSLMDKYDLKTITDEDKKTILAISKIETFDPSKGDKEKFEDMKNILENI